MSLVISKAVDSDFEEIRDLCIKVSESCVIPLLHKDSREAMRQARNRDLRKDFFLKNFEVLKAKYGQELVAYIAFRNEGYISQLYVSQKYQRQGVGSKLLRKYIETQSTHEIKLVASPNSVGFYLTRGFSRDSSRNIDPNPMNLIPLSFNSNTTIGNNHE